MRIAARMTTPIVMLLLLATPWLLSRTRAAGSIGLGLVFLFTGAGHFLETAAMAQMLPPWVPARVPLVHVTGVLELGLGAAFFVPSLRRRAGLAAAFLLLAFLPVNVYAALERVPMGGHAWGPGYLLVRVPLQAILLAWTWWFTLRPPALPARTAPQQIEATR